MALARGSINSLARPSTAGRRPAEAKPLRFLVGVANDADPLLLARNDELELLNDDMRALDV
jgi:hypothetical protein